MLQWEPPLILGLCYRMESDYPIYSTATYARLKCSISFIFSFYKIRGIALSIRSSQFSKHSFDLCRALSRFLVGSVLPLLAPIQNGRESPLAPVRPECPDERKSSTSQFSSALYRPHHRFRCQEYRSR